MHRFYITLLICNICIVLGHGIVAATASIPSKYQTIVTDNADKRGFLGQAKRFRFDEAMVSTRTCIFGYYYFI